MKKYIFLGISLLCILSLSAFPILKNSDKIVTVQSENEITAIIDKDTSEKDLEDLKNFFSENGIELIIKKIKFNKNKEITSLSLVLKKGSTKSQYSSSSNTPISDLELGHKDGNLFIKTKGSSDVAWFKGNNNHRIVVPNLNLDSLMQRHNLSFDFHLDKENDSLFFNGKAFDLSKLQDRIMNSFQFDRDEDGNFSFNGNQFHTFPKKLNRFNFIDNPDIDKLIIIDGKEEDFDTLDKLAKADKLEDVDFLKSKTAISIYGDKAKDGAIIATTKK